jgi:hypothetical protein
VASWPSSAKTWTNFKIYFAAAHHEFRLTNQTAQHSGFHIANMMIRYHPYQGTVEAIVQLEVATASDLDTYTTLTATNAKIMLQLERFQAYFKKLKEAIVQLKLEINPAWQGVYTQGMAGLNLTHLPRGR